MAAVTICSDFGTQDNICKWPWQCILRLWQWVQPSLYLSPETRHGAARAICKGHSFRKDSEQGRNKEIFHPDSQHLPFIPAGFLHSTHFLKFQCNIFWFLLKKKLAYKWTHAVQACVVQWLNVFSSIGFHIPPILKGMAVILNGQFPFIILQTVSSMKAELIQPQLVLVV